MAIVKIADSDEEIASCWEAMSLLRPGLVDINFVAQINAMRKEGYTLLYISEKGKIVSVAGYRFMTMLYCGHILYLDDLSTLERFRGKGYASLLLKYIFEIAKQSHCCSVHLDSGHLRHDAHRLYLDHGFVMNAHHFNKILLLETREFI
jgi:GNAT superfamily N-acetyltransferase